MNGFGSGLKSKSSSREMPKPISKKLSKLKNADDDSSVDSHGNVKNLIDYEYDSADDEEESTIAKRIKQRRQQQKKSEKKNDKIKHNEKQKKVKRLRKCVPDSDSESDSDGEGE